MNPIKSHTLFIIGFSFLAIVISSCNLINSDNKIEGNKEGVYEGIYLQGIEDSWFHPCIDEEESWRPLLTEETFAPIREALSDAESYRVFVKAKGIPSKKGKYEGWLTEYDREFDITEIIETRPTDSGKCP
ncbi:hypothetical protein [Rhodohalobacter sp. 614A]|uniref:hypothetical protein n=1 Tax=Rhodohalobacter sp. 614A TaxID=2908649 RepID=UPI001F1B9F65|nr:hypothetical protein [Rhodohalobacter sp. 614A]